VLDGSLVVRPVRQDVLVGHVVEAGNGVQVASVFALEKVQILKVKFYGCGTVKAFFALHIYALQFYLL
jgi:hypothetical protein